MSEADAERGSNQQDEGTDRAAEPSAHDAAAFVAHERAHRLAKLAALRERQIEPYPVRFDPDRKLSDVRAEFGELQPGQETDATVRVAGRIMLIRRHGGVVFADLKEGATRIQLMVSHADVGDESFADFEALDLGDWVGAEGTVMTTRRGELSIRVRHWQLLSKALRALPDKTRGLADVDARYRQRYLDLIVNEDTRRIFDIRSRTIAAVRRVLGERGYVEVETPVLDSHAGGAAARPFITHHNALDIDMFMRIALELHLKRLIVGGVERVFEIGRVFRNEGLDPRHNPEFTLLEAYQAYADYHDMMDLTEAIVAAAAEEAIGTTAIEEAGRTIDLKPPWPRVKLAELVREHAGVEMHPSMPLEEARSICARLGVPYEQTWGAGRLMSEVYDATAESTLVEPTFVLDYPREVSPLARAHRDDPELVERFELVVAGRELANAYSELNDPVDQRERLEAQAALKAAGDEEAESIDEDYVRALEYGLPPTGGLGVGLDRLVMLLAGASSIREVILFPTMRPEEGAAGKAAPALAASAKLPTAESLALDAATAAPAEPPPAAPLPGAVVSSLPHTRAARALGALAALVGLVFLVPIIPGIHAPFGLAQDPLLDHSARVVGHVASVLAGLGLLFVARQLARQKRQAWRLAVAISSAAALVSLVKGPHPVAGLLSGAMLLALVWWRDAFRARGDPRSLLALARFLPLYLIAVVAFGGVSLLLEKNALSAPLTVGGALETTFAGLVGLDGPYGYEHRLFGDFFPLALLALGITGLLVAGALAFRSVRQRAGPTPAERERAAELVRAHGSDTLAYFALRADKSYFFSSDGQAVIAYAYMGGYALAAGDPIGAPEAVPRALDEFLAFCRERAWRVAFLAVREGGLELYRQRGLASIYLGDEAIVPCDRFSLEGSAMKSVRSAVSHVGKSHSFRLIRESEASPQLVAQLNEISERWRGKEPERGFTMALGEDVEGREPDFLLSIADAENDRPAGFLRLVPCYGDDPGYSLDLMRRLPDAANGITEFLIANTALALGERGFRRLSMNFAAWGRLFAEGAPLSARDRALRRVAKLLNPFFQIQSLHDFNQKLGVDWLPRSIVIENPAALPRVGLLYATVEGFVRLPLIGRYLVPRVG